MLVKAVNIGEYGYMPFSFDCVKAVYSGGIYMKFAVFLHSDNSAYVPMEIPSALLIRRYRT
ncbi:hypothetical protein [Ruminococcus sp.]|uniref:hypothetical protein n=1 Tax=Ruminococcus sp. TaxID=41978 RepID=UPI0025D02CAA|nr:hypothetical protein [Ruminococcus sp.]